MRRSIIPCRHWAIALAFVFATGLTAIGGEIVYGPDARAEFEELVDRVGDIHLDFEAPDFTAGTLGEYEIGGVVLTFKTTEKRWPPPSVAVDYPVTVRSGNSGSQGIIGAGSASGGADGQNRYEITFSEPQGRVGLLRAWNTSSITRFYNPSGVLLGEHRNTQGNEFVGWMAGGPDEDEWVAKVVMDGVYDGAYQVGDSDDLFFGTANPDGGGMIGLVHGSEAEELFQQFVAYLGDTVIDFEDRNAGPLREMDPGSVVLTLKTTQQRYPSMMDVDYPVCVLPYSFVSSTPSGTNEITGTRSSTGLPDGQSRYQIVFSEPQHRAAVQRNWNTNSITRFYAGDGSLLAEHRNSVNHEFVGWIGDPGETGTWVKTIEMDSLLEGGSYHVGNTDDLHFGSILPNREPMRITQVTLTPQGMLSIHWEPAQVAHSMEFSTDRVNWQPAEGDLGPTSWTGTIDGDPVEIYYRVLTEKLFPD
ncbi:MAG: hypothetical protein ACP5I4_08985 [Oceanipulchritudo sp.]